MIYIPIKNVIIVTIYSIIGTTMEKVTRNLFLSACFLLCLTSISEAGYRKTLTKEDIEYLTETFSCENYSRSFLRNVFNDRRLRYIPGLVKQNISSPDYSHNYSRFLKPAAISMAKKFTRKWHTRLTRASTEFDVDKEVIVAILLVETSLGRYMGNVPVMSVFASIMLDNHRKNSNNAAGSPADGFSKDPYRERLARKAQWAQEELHALLAMKKEHKINIHSLKGSYAGAFGIPQFLPTSYLKWGRDGDGSKTVDLFYIPDAIVSVVNYLQAHGWKKSLDQESKKAVIWNYNNSTVYVNTVLQVVDLLQKTFRDEIAALSGKEPKG